MAIVAIFGWLGHIAYGVQALANVTLDALSNSGVGASIYIIESKSTK